MTTSHTVTTIRLFNALRQELAGDTDIHPDHFCDTDGIYYTYNDFQEDLENMEEDDDCDLDAIINEFIETNSISESMWDDFDTFCPIWADFKYDYYNAVRDLRRDAEIPPPYETVILAPPPYSELPPYVV